MIAKLFTLLLLSLSVLSAPVRARIAWAVETSNPVERTLDLRRGETLDLECRFTSYAAAMDLTGCSVVLHAVTNGMAAGTSFQTSGTITNGSAAVVSLAVDSWLPAAFTAGSYTLEVSAQSGTRRLLRASGKLSVSGIHYPSTADPVPVSWATNLYAILETKLAAPDVVAGDYVNIVPDGRRIRISSTAPLGGVTVTNPIVRVHNPANVSRSWAEIRTGEIWLYTVTDKPLWKLTATALLDTPATNYFSDTLPYPLATLTNSSQNTEFFFGSYRLTVNSGVVFYTAAGELPDSPSTIQLAGNTLVAFTNTLSYYRLQDYNPPYGTEGTIVLAYGDYGFLQTNIFISALRTNVLWTTRPRPVRKQVRVVSSNSVVYADGTRFTNALSGAYNYVFNYQDMWVWLQKAQVVTGTNDVGQIEIATDYRWFGDYTFENVTTPLYFGRPDTTASLYPFTMTNGYGYSVKFYREVY